VQQLEERLTGAPVVEQIQLDELPIGQRAPILKGYLRRAPGARAHISVNKDAPISEFEEPCVV
jgi:hypothetical protein